jgi:hypothetical protein
VSICSFNVHVSGWQGSAQKKLTGQPPALWSRTATAVSAPRMTASSNCPPLMAFSGVAPP